MSKMIIIEGNSNDKDNVRAYMVKGEPGTDGVSPTVTTSKTGSVSTITITDAEGDHAVTINDGEITQADLTAGLNTRVSNTSDNSTTLTGTGEGENADDSYTIKIVRRGNVVTICCSIVAYGNASSQSFFIDIPNWANPSSSMFSLNTFGGRVNSQNCKCELTLYAKSTAPVTPPHIRLDYYTNTITSGSYTSLHLVETYVVDE